MLRRLLHQNGASFDQLFTIRKSAQVDYRIANAMRYLGANLGVLFGLFHKKGVERLGSYLLTGGNSWYIFKSKKTMRRIGKLGSCLESNNFEGDISFLYN